MGFCGKYTNNLDEKNRLFIPSKLRNCMGGDLILLKAPEGCIYAYEPEEWEAVVSQAENADNDADRIFSLWLFANSQPVEIDKQGRILLDADFIEHAKLEKAVVFVGCDKKIQLWNADSMDTRLAKVKRDKIVNGFRF